MGHVFVGVVEDVGTDVRTVKRGDVVVAPFAISDGTCEFCNDGLQTSLLTLADVTGTGHHAALNRHRQRTWRPKEQSNQNGTPSRDSQPLA